MRESASLNGRHQPTESYQAEVFPKE